MALERCLTDAPVRWCGLPRRRIRCVRSCVRWDRLLALWWESVPGNFRTPPEFSGMVP